MDLVKRCEAQYCLPQSKTLRLGSLREYRRIEELALRDVREGQMNLHFEFPSDLLFPKHVFAGFFPGYFDLPPFFFWDPRGLYSSQGLSIVATGDEVLVKAGGKHSWMFPNCYVFSMQESAAEPIVNDGKYVSNWVIADKDIGEFAERLRVCVDANIRRLEVIWSSVLPLVQSADELSVVVRHGPVQYKEDAFQLDERDVRSPLAIVEKLWLAPFIKPPFFSPEREYRFVVGIEFKNRPVPIHDMSLIVPSNEFENLLA